LRLVETGFSSVLNILNNQRPKTGPRLRSLPVLRICGPNAVWSRSGLGFSPVLGPDFQALVGACCHGSCCGYCCCCFHRHSYFKTDWSVFCGGEKWVAYSPGAPALPDMFLVVVVKVVVVLLRFQLLTPPCFWLWVGIHKRVEKLGRASDCHGF